jgi:hypothetical protein
VFIKEKSAEKAVEASRRIKPGDTFRENKLARWRGDVAVDAGQADEFESGQERLTNLRRGERKEGRSRSWESRLMYARSVAYDSYDWRGSSQTAPSIAHAGQIAADPNFPIVHLLRAR